MMVKHIFSDTVKARYYGLIFIVGVVSVGPMNVNHVAGSRPKWAKCDD